MSTKPVIAIDGPAASGKGTLARRVAEAMGYALLDTGALYRAVGLSMIRAGQDVRDVEAAMAAARALDAERIAELTSDPALRQDETAQAASIVSAYPGVRQALLEFQRGFAANPPGDAAGAVLDGRDIGTVICPDAPVKLFITASVEVRAERRFKELGGAAAGVDFDAVLADMRARDERDTTRAFAPLIPAEDAVVVDNSALGPDAAFQAAMAIVHTKLKA
ncbi:(d)CMP kinase [Niveispirillum sp. SYP-B3756]|uniref:(d)CMP kinase n=1 Tax=Niveispirillum sp. SYP-B3756 TaxID=2662178 RepID=UPI0012921DCB|nr:(d)CMP kinase [Niveispirillum sp. SYP-B3756]MQP64229.1 (d)CMP kinase [Niveispirillum sp. SYP-B3756]